MIGDAATYSGPIIVQGLSLALRDAELVRFTAAMQQAAHRLWPG